MTDMHSSRFIRGLFFQLKILLILFFLFKNTLWVLIRSTLLRSFYAHINVFFEGEWWADPGELDNFENLMLFFSHS